MSYFLNFNASEGRWQLLATDGRNISRLRIYDDGGPLVVPTTVEQPAVTDQAK